MTYLSASIIAMRALALLAAIAVIHTTHALPRHDLTVRQGENDLSNDSHVFHHLDRNQRTANRNRNRTHGDSTEGSGLYVVKRLPDRSKREAIVDRRFMEDPDYSQGDSRGGSNSANPASNTMPTQQPPAKAETPREADNSHGRS